MTLDSLKQQVYKFLQEFDEEVDTEDEVADPGFHIISRGDVKKVIPWTRVRASLESCESPLALIMYLELLCVWEASSVEDVFDRDFSNIDHDDDKDPYEEVAAELEKIIQAHARVDTNLHDILEI